MAVSEPITRLTIKLATEITGSSRNTLYGRALEIKRAAEEE